MKGFIKISTEFYDKKEADKMQSLGVDTSSCTDATGSAYILLDEIEGVVDAWSDKVELTEVADCCLIYLKSGNMFRAMETCESFFNRAQRLINA